MKGFILAAGFGTRLRPITDHIPKALVPVCGKPLIEHGLSFCARQGITDIGINAHYMADQLAAYRERSPLPFTLFHERDAIRGTGGALFFAREFLSGEETFLVCNVDIVHASDTGARLETLLQPEWLGCLIAAPSRGSGTIFYDPRTSTYCGVPSDGDRPEGAKSADFIGVAVYRRAFLDVLTDGDFSIVPVWQRAAAKGKIGVSVIESRAWRDIGTPGTLARIHFERLDGTMPLDVPDHLYIDAGGRRCFHRDLPISLRRFIGPHAWVETPLVPETFVIERSIVLSGARLDETAAGIKDRIVTPFGEVAFD